ncbi:MAG: DNA-processing protein DprA [Cytophagales bacterium]|nr:DNA-processing protein DprA [Bernardetiaceae bacterium]MDW8203573.1 DNA-processing protein DprA [Cytophagales bacterium]
MAQLYEVALSFIPHIGNVLTKQLVSYCGSAEQVFKTTKGKLLKIPQIGEKTAQLINEHRAEALRKAEATLKQAAKEGIQLLFYTDTAYPQRLRQLADAPALLYWQGNATLNAALTVGIVGTRKATSYGKTVTEQIVAQLQAFQAHIISGLAYGIDIVAHREAIKHNLPTIAVMGSSLDRIYPTEHTPIARRMLANGGLLSEYPFGTAPAAPHFPNRNRIIAALSDAVIVVEAATKGGALITAEYANQYNREVFAVPGNLGQTYSEGCNLLIQQHKAHIFTSVAEMATMMYWQKEQKQTATTQPLPLPKEEAEVYSLLKQKGEMHLDELAWQSGLGVSQAAVALLSLEFQGLVKSLPGKKFAIAK